MNFVVYVKFIHRNQKIYMVHTLFWIDSRIFLTHKNYPLCGIHSCQWCSFELFTYSFSSAIQAQLIIGAVFIVSCLI